MVGKDGMVQIDAVLSPIYFIQSVFLSHTAGLLVASARSNLAQIQTLDALRKHVGPLVQWDKEVLEDLVDVVPMRVLHRFTGKLNNKLIHQGPRHVLHEIVVCVSAGDFEVDIEHEGERARTMTSFSASLGTLTYRVSPGLALVGLKVILFTVRSAFIAPRTFSECEGSRLGGTAMVYNVFSKLICILVMAEGGVYDPTTENETPWEDHRIDHDDDDDDEQEVNTTQPFQPGASSTPYHEGEAHEMANMGEEGEGIPLLSKYADFVPPEDKETLINRFKAFIKAKRPTVDFSKMVIALGKQKGNEGKAVALGPKGGETVIFKQDNTFTAKFSQQYSGALGSPAENIIAEDNTALQDTQRRLDEAQQLEARLNAQAQKQEQETQERQRLETQLEQINQRIENMVNEGGTEMERKMETDRLKTGKRQARERHQGSKEAGKGICTKQQKHKTRRQKKLSAWSANMRTKNKREILPKQP